MFGRIKNDAVLKEFYYSPGYSDMRGGSHREYLRKDEDGKWKIITEDRESFNKPTKVTVYAADEEAVCLFEAFLKQKKTGSLANRPDSELFVTDYSPWHYGIEFELADESLPSWKRRVDYSIGEYKRYSKKDYELIGEMRERFRALLGEVLSETLVEEEQ